jgi:acyl-CoA thioester hydrolase
MTEYIQKPEIRWADLDPNFHLRHSVYYDLGAYCRISYLQEHGLTPVLMQELHFGPVIFREEAVFRKELRMGDRVSIDLQVTRSKNDFSRWSIRHQLFKDGLALAATISIDGAWMNTQERKLASPPAQIIAVFETMPRSEGFEWV